MTEEHQVGHRSNRIDLFHHIAHSLHPYTPHSKGCEQDSLAILAATIVLQPAIWGAKSSGVRLPVENTRKRNRERLFSRCTARRSHAHRDDERRRTVSRQKVVAAMRST
jgi:hypothetical protein